MVGYTAYQLQQAINLHFTPNVDYDFFKYHGKTKTTVASFEKSPLKYQYIGLERASNNLLFNFYLLYRDMNFSYAKPSYTMFKRIKHLSNDYKLTPNEFITSVLEDDLSTLKEEFKDDLYNILKIDLYGEPVIANLYRSNKISIETLILIDCCIGKVLKLESSPDPIGWPKFINKVNKIRPFVESLFSTKVFKDVFARVYLEDK